MEGVAAAHILFRLLFLAPVAWVYWDLDLFEDPSHQWNLPGLIRCLASIITVWSTLLASSAFRPVVCFGLSLVWVSDPVRPNRKRRPSRHLRWGPAGFQPL